MVTHTIGLPFGGKSARRYHRRRLSSLAGFLILAVAILSTPAASGREVTTNRPVDANVLVRKMIAMYQGTQTLEEATEARVKEYGKSDYVQSTTLRFKRPNLIYLSSEDPAIGTYQGFCNGKTITVYSGTQNTYTKRNSPTDLRQTLGKFSAAGEYLMGVSIVQMLSSIDFIAAKTMPDECKNFQFIRNEILDGNRVTVVTGQANSGWLATMGAPKETVYARREVTLWIDTSRFLLRKASCDLQWRVNVGPTEKKSAQIVLEGIKFVETHRSTRVNTPLRDEDFFFIAPKGAVERFQERK